MRVALGQSSRRGGWGGGSQGYQRQKWEPTGSEPTPSPPGPTLVFISTSSNVPRNSISYKITSQVPREPEALFIIMGLSGDHTVARVDFLLWDAGPLCKAQLTGTSVGWGVFSTGSAISG